VKVHRLSLGLLQTNCFIAADDNSGHAIIIDPGDEAERVLTVLRQHNLTTQYIVNTHGHADHVGANRELREATGAPILIHQGDAEMLRGAGREMALMMGMDIEPIEPDRLLEEGDQIELGAYSLKVLHTPGHTPGSISLVTKGRVFTGDCLFAGGVGRWDFPGGDERALFESIQTKLLALPDDTIVHPGHGPDTTIGEEREGNPFLT